MTVKSNTIITDMATFIRNNPEGVSSSVLAETFLKFKNPDEHMAHIAVSGILSQDRRCVYDSNSRWSIKQSYTNPENMPLESMPWVVLYLLSNPSREDSVLHASLWAPFETPQCLFSGWLTDPQSLSYEEQELLLCDSDTPFKSRTETLSQLIKLCMGHTVLFLSSRQQRIFNQFCMTLGESVPDDTMLISQFFKILALPLPKPLNLYTCYTQLQNRDPVLQAAYHYGEALCECILELISKLGEKGITTRHELDRYELEETCTAVWDDADFSPEDITALSSNPGVYGFKNRNGEYIYIGKANNLKRRILSYFRNTEESPEKLIQLRKQAHTLTVSECGSELECLITEYRLIKKYQPGLNSKLDIYERKGTFTPLQDSIILLPHAEEDKGMSIWFKKDQKIFMKPFYTDFRDMVAFRETLDKFFLQERLPANPSDFPEQELVHRWVKKNKNVVNIVPVYRLSSSEEISQAIQNCWIEN